MICAPTATRTRDLPLRRSFHNRRSTAALLARAGLAVVWVPFGTCRFRLVLAREWHGAWLSCCHNGSVPSIRDKWNNAVRLGEEKSARAARASQQKAVTTVHGLQGMTDEELIAAAPPRNSLSSRSDHEMEMQRRLKDSINALTEEARRTRWWGFWGTVALGVLTTALIALTIVLAVRA
jgi:hypothetical protein